MSAYAEWKYGLLTDEQYRQACLDEEWQDKIWEAQEDQDD